MGLISGIWLVVLGLLGAYSLIVARKPDAQAMLDKLVPFQGWIGLLSLIWGLWYLISGILNLGTLSSNLIWLITYFAMAACLIGLGLLLGIGIIRGFIKNPESRAKLEGTVLALSPYQGTLGIVSIVLGVWGIVATILY